MSIVVLCLFSPQPPRAAAQELLYFVQSRDAGAAISVIDPDSGVIRAAIALNEARGLPYESRGTADLIASPDGRYVYVLFAPDAGTSRLVAIDTSTNRIVSTVRFAERAGRFACTRDGRLCYVIAIAGRSPSALLRIDTGLLSVTGSVELRAGPTDVALSPAGDVAYLTSGFGDGLLIVNTADQTLTSVVDLSHPPYSLDTRAVAVSPDGERVYVLSADRISVIDAAAHTVNAVIDLGYSQFPLDLALSPNGAIAYVPESNAHAVAVIDTSTESPIAPIPLREPPERVGFNDDGSLAWTIPEYGDFITLIDARSRLTRELQLSGHPVGAALVAMPARAACGNGQVDAAEECDDGNTISGDGCASNCTRETVRNLLFDGAGSRMRITDAAGTTELALTGFARLRVGKSAADGRTPVAVRAQEFQFDPIPIPGVGCACLSVAEQPGYGPGLGAAGEISCGPQDVEGIDYRVEQDHHTDDEDPECLRGVPAEQFGIPIEPTNRCLGVPHVQDSASGGAGSALLRGIVTMVTVADGGTCSIDPSNAWKGSDGVPCTSDDPIPDGATHEVLYTTGRAEAVVLDANDTPGARLSTSAAGVALRCDPSMSVDGAAFAAVIADADFIYYLIGEPPPPGHDRVLSIELSGRDQGPGCTGDCNGDRRVTVDEVIRSVAVSLNGLPLRVCLAADEDLDGRVQIAELIKAVTDALRGCQ